MVSRNLAWPAPEAPEDTAYRLAFHHWGSPSSSLTTLPNYPGNLDVKPDFLPLGDLSQMATTPSQVAGPTPSSRHPPV